MAGILTDSRGDVPVNLIWELPGRFRLDEAGAQGRSLGFDGAQSWNARANVSASDQDTIETLAGETVEAFLLSIAQGSAYRILGRRFRSDNGLARSYTGPYSDIYELAGPASVRNDRLSRTKRFYFDSITEQLNRVSYSTQQQGRTVRVEVGISDWKRIDGQLTPGRVTRTEDGRTVFSLRIDSAQFGARLSDGVFRKP
jgi:hypothetical protein